MSKTAILVDGGFYRKRAKKLWGERNPQVAANGLITYVRRHLHEHSFTHELYRIFYYDCPPVNKQMYHPLDPSAPDYKIRLAERRTEIMVLREQLEIWKRKALNVMRLEKEIGKMKRGSIALVGQITTVSKIRIYDPLYPSDSLASIHLSDVALDKLDQKVKELYTYEKK